MNHEECVDPNTREHHVEHPDRSEAFQFSILAGTKGPSIMGHIYYYLHHLTSFLRFDFHGSQFKLPLLVDTLTIPGVGIRFALRIDSGSSIRVDVRFVRRFGADSRAGAETESEERWNSACC
jgi:hypothetical protein